MESDYPKGVEDLGVFNKPELIRKCQENTWLKRWGVAFREDPFMETDYGYNFMRYETIDELRKFFKHGNWAIRCGAVHENLCFVQQVNGGDEWWVIKKFPYGELIGFESISFSHIISNPKPAMTFEAMVDHLLKATEERCFGRAVFWRIRMGVIVQTILALKGRYDYVLQAADEINTGSLETDLERLVFESFEALRPLRSEYVVVGDLKDDTGKVYEQIGVGEFIRQRSGGDTYGSNFRPDSEWSRRRFVELMREHGHLVTPHVRASIQEDFGRLMQITRDLKPYDEITVSLEVDPPITVHRHTCNKYSNHLLEMDEKRVVKLFLRTSDSEKIVYNKVKDDESGYWPGVLDVSYEANIPVVEDLIDYLVKIYKMAGELVDETKRHNEPLMAEMDTLASAYKVSKCLT